MTTQYKVKAPSNIALLKYWGKSNGQYPINPNISFTLKNALTELEYSYQKRVDRNIVISDLLFDEKSNLEFKNNLENKFKRLFNLYEFPFGIDLVLKTNNTFPHSSGIASSASSMACIAKMLSEIYQLKDRNVISSFARELSGSACRSVSSGWNLWGQTDLIPGSSQEHSVVINERIHPGHHTLQNWIFVCSQKVKSLSSSEGHKLMENHIFLPSRIESTHSRLKLMLNLLEIAPSREFFEIVEKEALELHALMMTSHSPFILLEPESLSLMSKITNLRKQGINCGYTLDAGSSVHLLFPKDQLELMKRNYQEHYFGQKGTHFVDILWDECQL